MFTVPRPDFVVKKVESLNLDRPKSPTWNKLCQCTYLLKGFTENHLKHQFSNQYLDGPTFINKQV